MFAKKLVAETLALARALYEAGDVDNFEPGGKESALNSEIFARTSSLGSGTDTKTNVWLNRAERKVRGLRLGIGDDRIKKGRLSDVGQTDIASS